MLTIVASMEQEVAGLRRELRRRVPWDVGPPAQGGWTGATPDVRVIGVGEARAVEAACLLLGLSRHPHGRPLPLPEKLLMVGFTGGVDPTLPAGQLVLSSRYYLDAGAMSKQEPAGILGAVGRENYLGPDPEMWRQAVEAAAEVGVSSANVDSLTVSRLVTSPQAKRALGQLYPVGVVNMEDYWVARTARKAGVPFLSARVVLDPADQALPGYLLGLSGSRTRAILSTAALPWRVPAVLSLARRVPPAQRVLAKFALAFLERLDRGEAADRGPVTSTSGLLSRSGRNART
jgi:nucleoside phosphorylase